MKSELQELLRTRRDLWQGHQHPVQLATLPTGFHELDQQLGGGWPVGTLTELIYQHDGSGELSLLLPALASSTRHSKQRAAFVSPPHTPYAPALLNAGITLERLTIAQAEEQTLWASEQLLRSGLFDIVVLWPKKTSNREQRRLQLAAEAGHAVAICYRPYHTASEHSAAGLRVCLHTQANTLQLDIIKSRGSRKIRPITLTQAQLFDVRKVH